MSAGKWTPGPWSLLLQGKTIQVSAGETHSSRDAIVFWTGFDSSDRKLAEKQANARLIAAAPDLLEALEDMVRVFDCGLPEQCIGRTICDNSIAAIKKARGES